MRVRSNNGAILVMAWGLSAATYAFAVNAVTVTSPTAQHPAGRPHVGSKERRAIDSEAARPRGSRLNRNSNSIGTPALWTLRAPASPTSTKSPAGVVDLTRLPPIDSIVADTDIRPFMQAGVPEDLTRAALRRAWVVDPAIREFVGTADNQWNFNDLTSVPGFGQVAADANVREPSDSREMRSRVRRSLARVDLRTLVTKAGTPCCVTQRNGSH